MTHGLVMRAVIANGRIFIRLVNVSCVIVPLSGANLAIVGGAIAGRLTPLVNRS